MKKKIFAGALVLAGAMGSLALQAQQEKVQLCHLDDEGEWIVITVAAPAVAAHLAHGDSLAYEGSCTC